MLEISKYRVMDVTQVDGGLIRVIRNHWWWCEDGNPQKAIFYIGAGWRKCYSPQCNSDKRVVESIGVPFENAQIVQIQTAFVPVKEYRE